ncbi:MAG: GNAT family N-acetyltransferase [Phormidesmis sp.]
MNIQLASAADLPALAELYRQTVLVNAPQYYSPAQTQMWAAAPTDAEHFHQFVLAATTFVAKKDTDILGFAGIKADGHVASVYVRHDCIRQGVGSALMRAVLGYAQSHNIGRLHAEASEFSLGLFKKFGFRRYDTEVVVRQGVEFERYLVERYLVGPQMV